MNALHSLALGLRQAGRVMSPEVSEELGKQERAEEQHAFQLARDEQAQRQARTTQAVQLITRAAETGALSPEAARARLQELGLPDVPIGPDAATQARNEALQRRTKVAEGLRALPPEERLNPLNLAGVFLAAGDHEQGAKYLDAHEARQAAKMKQAADLEARRHEIEMRLEDKALDRESRERLSTAANAIKGQLAEAQLEIARGNQELRRLGLRLQEQGVEIQRQGLDLRREQQQQGRALPAGPQDALTGALNMYRALDTIEQNISESGIGEGLVSKGQAALGFNDKAIAFDTAVNNLKVQAQAIIKGIPSNFDVQTFIATIPTLTAAEKTNKERIKQTRASVDQVVRDTISYYKGMRYNVPDYIVAAARQRGIDVGNVRPWDGRGDPLQASIDKLKPSGGTADDPLGLRGGQ